MHSPSMQSFAVLSLMNKETNVWKILILDFREQEGLKVMLTSAILELSRFMLTNRHVQLVFPRKYIILVACDR